jgi:SAM-dependent methyltransferase
VGLDASAELLELARLRSDLPDDTTLVPCDLVTETESAAWAERKFSLVAMFGLLHHVPSFARRRALLRGLAEHVEPGGSLAFSVWRFGAFERFQHKQVPFAPPIETADLEPGDALLRFGTQPGVVRYCHYLDEQEAERLLDAVPLPCRDRFSADGREQALNDYFVLGPAP